jgi:hypothetical protein
MKRTKSKVSSHELRLKQIEKFGFSELYERRMEI